VWIFFVICTAVFIYIGVPYIYRRYAGVILRKKVVKSGAIVLTFDDGPSDELTAAILNLLKEYDAKATFFLLGKSIAGRQDIVRQIAQRGHEICSHGYDHLNYWKVSPFRSLADIKKGWQAIDAALGQNRKCYPFRPPYGKMNIFCLLYLWIHRVPIIYWTTDCGDRWETKPSCHTIAEAAKTGGTVALVHVSDRKDGVTNNFSLESVRLAMAAAKGNSMRILTMSELLNSNK
jgi:peptidoglycan/xylan/chitin deacetylase (PgdA/CDA1 family)